MFALRKNEVFHKDFVSKCDQIRRKCSDLVTFNEEILNGKLHFCAVLYFNHCISTVLIAIYVYFIQKKFQKNDILNADNQNSVLKSIYYNMKTPKYCVN